jgi:hypothetical protein
MIVDDASAMHIVVYTVIEAKILRIRDEGHRGGAEDIWSLSRCYAAGVRCGLKAVRKLFIVGTWMAPATKAVRSVKPRPWENGPATGPWILWP